MTSTGDGDEDMSKLQRKKSGRVGPAPRRGRSTLLVIAAVLASAGIIAVAVAFRGGEPQQSGAPQAPSAARGIQGAVIALAEDSGFGKLNGRWLRPDGGYVLEIRGTDTGEPIGAGYFNPRLIDVARAHATRDGSALKVFVELRAPGYPGSTYTLTYDAQRDQLEGTYFQAALGQTFPVAFVRLESFTR